MAKEGSFTTDAVRLTASKVIGNIITLVSAMLLARIRTLEENGIYSELLLVINLATVIIMLGLPNSINYFLTRAESKEEKNKFLSLYYSLSTVLSLILGVILVALLPLWVMFFDDVNLYSFSFFLFIFPWAKVVTASVENVLVVLGKSKSLVSYRISNSICLLLIILFIWITNNSFMIYMILYVIIESVYAITVYLLAGKYTGRLHWNINKQLIISVMKFSIPLGLASIVGTINIEIDKLMIGYMLSTEELAIYTNASKELPLTIVATSLTAVLMPKMVKCFQQNKNVEAVAIWRDVATISFAIIAFFGVGMAFFSTDAMIVLYSEKYAPGGPVFAIYSIVLLLKCTYFGIVLNSTGNTKLILYSALGTLVLNTIMNIGFYHLFGVVGPALATLVSGIMMNLFQLIFSSRIINVKFKDIFPWKNIAIIVLINISLGLIFYYIHIALFPGNFQAIILAVLWGIVYFFILLKPGKNYWRKLKSV